MYDTVDGRRVSSPRLRWVITREDPYLGIHVLRVKEGQEEGAVEHVSRLNSTCVLWRPKKEKESQGQKRKKLEEQTMLY
jgi:hypothetical protein